MTVIINGTIYLGITRGTDVGVKTEIHETIRGVVGQDAIDTMRRVQLKGACASLVVQNSADGVIFDYEGYEANLILLTTNDNGRSYHASVEGYGRVNIEHE